VIRVNVVVGLYYGIPCTMHVPFLYSVIINPAHASVGGLTGAYNRNPAGPMTLSSTSSLCNTSQYWGEALPLLAQSRPQSPTTYVNVYADSVSPDTSDEMMLVCEVWNAYTNIHISFYPLEQQRQ